jgi:type IV secretory pathway VirB10-like protein
MNEDDAIYVDSTSPVEPHPPSSPSTEEHDDVVEQDDATMESDVEDMEALDDNTEGMNDMAAAPAAEATEHELSVEDEDDNNDAMEHVPAEQETTSTISAPSHSGLLATDQGFSVRLPEDAVNSILAALESTPYDGFVPVVAFGPSGQIMLTFETREGQSG